MNALPRVALAVLVVSTGCSLTLDPNGVDLSQPRPVACGNGVREGLEGCDDGNLNSGDGCSSSCVVELDSRAPFATVTFNGLWMAVTPSGTIYMNVGGSGGSVDTITRIDPNGTVTPNAIPGVLTYYGGNVVAVGEDLVFGGSKAFAPATTYIQRWTKATNATTTLFQIGDVYYYHFAVNGAADRMFYAGYPGTTVYKVTSPTTSSAFATFTSGLKTLFYDQARDRLYAIADGALRVDATGGAGSTASFTALYWNANAGGMAIDGEGTIYVACTTSVPAPCTTGAVIAIDPSGVPSRDFVASNSIVRAIGWDATKNDLVVVTDARNVYRIPLAR